MVAVVSLLLVSFISKNNDNVVFSFDRGVDIGDWYVLNDGVMGGVSSSSIKIDKNGYGSFEGNVSTDNNGGFASIRYASVVQLKKAKLVKLKIKGDGKNYQFRLKKKTTDYQSYIHTFATSGEWETIEINLDELFPSFRGRKLDMPNFDANKFEELSLLIANGKNESFKLKIDSIEIE